MRTLHTVLQKGFTLIELVMVIIILSALGIMTSSYIGTGVDIYTGITDRDKSLNSVRFVMERLHREVSNALPNSAFVTAGGQCLTFMPIFASALYGDGFPISPLSANTGTISPLADYNFVIGDKAVVYLLDYTELASIDKAQPINAINADKDILTFSGKINFPLGSPAKRLFIIRDSISYCFSSNNLYRSVNRSIPILMAEHISGSFTVEEVTLQRNSLVQVVFNLDFDGQVVPIEQTLHINNVP